MNGALQFWHGECAMLVRTVAETRA